MRQTRQFGAYTALLAAVLFWGISYVGTKFALDGFSPLVLAFLRFALAALLFGILLLCHRWPATSRAFHQRIAGLATLLPGLYFMFENFGINYTTASKASMIIAMVPVAVALLSVLLLGERMTPRRVFSLGLSLAGVYLLLLYGKNGDTSLQIQLGDLLMLGAVLTAAIYMLLMRKLCAAYDPVLVTAYQMIYGALFFLPFFLWQAGDIRWSEVAAPQWAALLILALFSSAGAFLSYNYALKSVAASRASLFVNIVPLITVLASWLLLDEKLLASQLCGGLLVIGAACLASNEEASVLEESEEELFTQSAG